jgi:hypothetical protein
VAVEHGAAVLISSSKGASELDDLPLQLIIAALQLGLLRPLAHSFEIGGYDAVELVFDAAIAALPR